MADEPRDRLREPEARLLALRIAASRPGREASTTYIKEHIQDYIALTAEDMKPSQTRKTEQMWQQITGNVVSHKNRQSSIFSEGHAKRTEDGIRVTDKGIEYLKSHGY